MELLHNIGLGFQVAFIPTNILLCFVGVLVGTLIGVLPGIGPVGTIALLLPVTFQLSPAGGIIMLAGIFYGAQYGGSTTSILVNIPGESSSVVTCLDGYQMARKGRAGPALGIAAWGSFIAGTLSIIGLMLVSKALADISLTFGFPEYFAFMCAGLTIVCYLARFSMVKALMMTMLGLLLGSMGLDSITGLPRFTYGVPELTDGIGIIPVVMGLFGISEVLDNIEVNLDTRDTLQGKIGNLWPTFQDWMDAKWAILRGTIIGFCLGIVPGVGVAVSSFIAYATEKKVSKHPELFGTGVIEGVAGPESANNAAAGSSLIPLLSLGIPTNTTMAILFSALIIHGVQPGPLLVMDHPDIFWGLVASMYLGNVLLLVLNLPLIGMWVQVLKVPYRILFPIILLLCLIGAYATSGTTFDLLVMILFGAIGYLMKKFRYEAAPLVLAFVLGPMLETALRQSLLVSGGSFMIFVKSPVSAVTLSCVFILLLSNVLPFFKKFSKRVKEIEMEKEE